MLHVPGLAAAALLTVAALLGGCSPKGPAFVESGSSYTTATVVAAYARADTSKLAGVSVDEAAKLRHDTLVGLRSKGASGTEAADLITAVLGSEPRAVPVYVELANVDGTPAIIVVEASGQTGGTLERKRLWVLDTNGNVIVAGSR